MNKSEDALDGTRPRESSVHGAYHFEMGPIRPPSEGSDRSLLIRINRNCPWNRCRFCNTYRGERFEYRSVDEVLHDIDVVKKIADMLKLSSWEVGHAGRITEEVVEATIRRHPHVYGRMAAEDEELSARLHCLISVANWLSSGARTLFLQDANAIIMRLPELIQVLSYLKSTFPTIERITSYGRAKTANQRTTEELKALRDAGLVRLHIGMESGCDEVLAFMQKGVTAEEHIQAGKKIVASGISLSEYVMPGLGGRKWSERHAKDTAEALNQIGPDFIRLRSLVVRRNSALGEMEAAGEFEQLDEEGVVDEIRLLVEHLECESYLTSDQMSNLLWEVEGKLPQDKPRILEEIKRFQSMSRRERLRFRLQRRANSYIAVYGGMPQDLAAQVVAASKALDDQGSEPGPLVEAAIAQLKQGFV